MGLGMIKAVLFDLDNTLVDFMRMKEACCEAAIHAMIEAGLPLDKERARKKLFKMYERAGIENQEIFEKFLKATVGKVDYRMLAAGIAAYRRVKAGHIVPYPHVRETLVRLKEQGLRLGIVSDAPKLQAWLRLAEMNLVEFFDVVVALEDTGSKKPSKRTTSIRSATTVASAALSPSQYRSRVIRQKPPLRMVF